MEDDEDDIYAAEDTIEQDHGPKAESIDAGDAMDEDEVEEEEEEEEDSDSDIEIVTEQKESANTDSSKSASRQAPTRPESTPAATTSSRSVPTLTKPPSSDTPPPPQKPGSAYPAVRTSTIDIDAKPTHPPSGKPITELDIDSDLPDEKSWRIPGSDQTDYFNYGFDEFTWAAYCLKQTTLRAEAKEQKKAIGEFQNMFGGSNNPVAAAAVNAMPNPAAGGMMPGFPGDIPPEMIPAMQSMMASGMDPSQMDMGAFMQMMGAGGGSNMAQGYGGQNVGAGGMGYDAYGGQGAHAGGGGGGGRGGRRGRGRW